MVLRKSRLGKGRGFVLSPEITQLHGRRLIGKSKFLGKGSNPLLSFLRKYGALGLISGVPVAGRAAEFLALPLITRILDIEDFGLFDKSIALAMLLSVGAGFFLAPALHRLFRKGNETLVCSTFLFGASVITLAWFVLISGVVAVAYVFSYDVVSKYLGSPTIFLLSLLIGCGMGFYRLQEVALIRLSNLAATICAGLLPQILFLVGCGVAIIGGYKFSGAEILVFKLVISGSQVLIGFLYLYPYLTRNFSRRLLILSCRFSAPFLPAVGLTWISRNVIRWLILGALGISSMAVFSAGMQLAAAVGVFTQVFRNVWFIFSMKRKASKTRNLEFSIVWIGYFGFMVVLVGIFAIFGDSICNKVLPADYEKVETVLPLLLLSAVFMEGRVIGNVANFITGKTLSHMFDDFGAAIVAIGMAVILIPFFDIMGAAIALVCSGIYQILRSCRNARSKIGLKLPLIWPFSLLGLTITFSILRRMDGLFELFVCVFLLLVAVGLYIRAIAIKAVELRLVESK